MRIDFLTDDALIKLRADLHDNLGRYRANDQAYFIDVLASMDGLKQSRYTCPDFALDMSAEDPTDTDITNVKRVYEAMRELSPAVASDERLWTGFAHSEFWDYVQYRQKDSIHKVVKDPEDIKKQGTGIGSSFFFTNGHRRSLFVHCLSRLWWIGYLTYDEEARDPYHLTGLTALSSGHAFASTAVLFASSNMTSNKAIALGVLDSIEKRQEMGEAIERKHFVGSLRYLNNMGGLTLLDMLSREDVSSIVDAYLASDDFANLKLGAKNDKIPEDADDFDEDDEDFDEEVDEEQANASGVASGDAPSNDASSNDRASNDKASNDEAHWYGWDKRPDTSRTSHSATANVASARSNQTTSAANGSTPSTSAGAAAVSATESSDANTSATSGSTAGADAFETSFFGPSGTSAAQDAKGMSIARRAATYPQPRYGFVPVEDLRVRRSEDRRKLAEEESLPPWVANEIVRRLSQVELGAAAENVFKASLAGARRLGAEALEDAQHQISLVNGVSSQSIESVHRLVAYSSLAEIGAKAYRVAIDSFADEDTLKDIRIMVQRSRSFFEENGPILRSGFDVEGGYTDTVSSGRGDFLAEGSIWDLRAYAGPLTTTDTLRVLMYYLMGQRSVHQEFQRVVRIGVFNPRLYEARWIRVNEIQEATKYEVSSRVIGYRVR